MSAVNPDWLSLDSQLCFQLYASSRAITRLYKPLLDPLGLTYPQYLAMLVLWEWERQPPAAPTVRALGERLRLDSGTLTPLLKRMEQLGLVERQRGHGGDERQVHLRLTDTGSRLREQAEDIPRKLVCSTSMSTRDVMALRDQLSALLQQIGEVD
ncbi:MarR family transcriptional regulator [Halopseudomonas nanhaiensis]|uniref:MarR family winged helix-turn-helix transcriptional regulator n=1 Tax=Halopseudomonas nanhaiensis TaxID=2830842 RepID=UPI001CBC1AA7|nr:MarR family transcriptional regulator [Halopseudomonas nanhaiensis]UAW97163.1 MarR family transcriptional regulator [Halopseudomonas nanhaiensis]